MRPVGGGNVINVIAYIGNITACTTNATRYISIVTTCIAIVTTDMTNATRYISIATGQVKDISVR